MNIRKIDKWVWILIYLGMFAVALGLATQAADPALGWTLACSGVVAIAVGILLIWLRSRIRTDTA